MEILGEELRLGRLLKQAAFGSPDVRAEFLKLQEPNGPRTVFVAPYVNPMDSMYMLSNPDNGYIGFRSFFVYVFMKKVEANQAK